MEFYEAIMTFLGGAVTALVAVLLPNDCKLLKVLLNIEESEDE